MFELGHGGGIADALWKQGGTFEIRTAFRNIEVGVDGSRVEASKSG
jgi:hypothetical protein